MISAFVKQHELSLQVPPVHVAAPLKVLTVETWNIWRHFEALMKPRIGIGNLRYVWNREYIYICIYIGNMDTSSSLAPS